MAAMLTTVDNPFDPAEDFAAWYGWDVAHGYNTTAYLARVMVVGDDLPLAVQAVQIEKAIDEIIAEHGGEIYKKIMVPDKENQASGG